MRLLTEIIADVLYNLDRLKYHNTQRCTEDWLEQLYRDLVEVQDTMHENCLTSEDVAMAYEDGYDCAIAMQERDKEQDQ
jgi:hypothetical protein